MRTSSEWLCDTSREPGCQRNAVISFICRAEGSEIALCANCDRVWKAFAHGDPQLMARCPRCAPIYVSRAPQTDMAQAAKERARYRITSDDPVLTGPLADVLDNCMFAEGVLSPTRRAILARLHRLAEMDDSGYAAMLLRQTERVEVAT